MKEIKMFGAAWERAQQLRPTPQQAGKRIAEKILDEGGPYPGQVVDLRYLQTGFFISDFFKALIEHILEHAPERKDLLLELEWKVRFDYQRDRAIEWATTYVGGAEPSL